MTKNEILTHDNLTTFIQHGFEPNYVEGKNAVGTCPFCGADKFFILPTSKNKDWNCKVCGKKGGFLKFLEQILKENQKTIKMNAKKPGSPMQRLLEDREGINSVTIRKAEIGYNAETEQYVIPEYNEKDTLTNIRLYGKFYSQRKKKDIVGLRSTSNCNVILYGIDELQGHKNIMLCEGHWDTLVMKQFVRADELEWDVVGVAGAETFKENWVPYFKDKNVFVLYDNDKAGKAGALKVMSYLHTQTSDLQFLKWEDDIPKGFDIRDAYNTIKSDYNKDEYGGMFYNWIYDNCGIVPDASQEEINEAKGAVQSKEPTFTGGYIEPQEIYDEYQKLLHMESTDSIDILFATVIANRLPGNPVWLYHAAPSGFYKTELIEGFRLSPEVYSTSTLSHTSLISGMKSTDDNDEEISLIQRLNGKVLAIKDYTVLLGTDPTELKAINSILRDAFDGRIKKEFGNGKIADYISKFGIIACCTNAIYAALDGESALGPRFLIHREDVDVDHEDDFISRAIENSEYDKLEDIEDIRQKIKEIVARALQYPYHKKEVKLSKFYKRKLIKLARYISLCRGTIMRNQRTGDMEFKPFREIGTRVAKQLMKLSIALCQFFNISEIDDRVYNIIKNLGSTTIFINNDIILRALYNPKTNKSDEFTKKQLEAKTNLPVSTLGIILENLIALDLLKRKETKRMIGDTFVLSRTALSLINKSEIYD